MANDKLSKAKTGKNDEFYTQYADIQTEMSAYLDYNSEVFRDKTVLLPCDDPEWSNFTKFFAQNFERFGLKKVISTSYAPESKHIKAWEPTLFETESPFYDADKSRTNGKIFVLERGRTDVSRIDINALEWQYLEGDGDFRSNEVKALRDESDIIVTNPPFSLFREFFKWIMEADKQFVIVGHQNAISYKEVFPSIRDNKVWLGKGFKGGAGHFISKYEDIATAGNHKEGMIRVSGVVWFTNMDHGRRHQPLDLMTMEDNTLFSRHKEVKGRGYIPYANFEGIDIPYTDAIPSDYEGIMGVPISFLDKYCPDQFEILGSTEESGWLSSVGVKPLGKEIIDIMRSQGNKSHLTANMVQLYTLDNGIFYRPFARILIRKKK